MKSILKALPIAAIILTSVACEKKIETPKPIARDQVFKSTLKDVRLGDGVPLEIDVAVRWKVNDYLKFSDQFESPEKYDSLILASRELELANNVGNRYTNVDTLFNKQRHKFITDLKAYLKANLGEDGVEIKEVLVSNIVFPKSYTDSKETLAMLEQKLEQIRKQSLIDLQGSISAKKKAKSDGEVRMAQAEAEAKIQNIKAKTEKSIRLSRLAKAETEKQVSKLRAQADAERKVLLSKADLKKKQDLQKLAIQKVKDLDNVELVKDKKKVDLKFDTELRMAKLCSENPTYATYIVNKELASKVKIAVLPGGQDGNVFDGLLKNGLTSK